MHTVLNIWVDVLVMCIALATTGYRTVPNDIIWFGRCWLLCSLWVFFPLSGFVVVVKWAQKPVLKYAVISRQRKKQHNELCLNQLDDISQQCFYMLIIIVSVCVWVCLRANMQFVFMLENCSAQPFFDFNLTKIKKKKRRAHTQFMETANYANFQFTHKTECKLTSINISIKWFKCTAKWIRTCYQSTIGGQIKSTKKKPSGNNNTNNSNNRVGCILVH